MFFILSKVLGALVLPSNLLLLLLAVGCLALMRHRRRMGALCLGAGMAFYLAAGLGPLGLLLLRPLEDRFPRPPDNMAAPTGIIVLGGGMNEILYKDRQAFVLGSDGSRMTDAFILSRRFPGAKVIFTGGSNAVIDDEGITEADAARAFYSAMGMAPERLVLEDRSRNTDENARFTREIVKPQPGERFVLVTSAVHMPRAVGLFRKAGFDVVPYPSNYQTRGTDEDFWRMSTTAASGLSRFDQAAREWVGLLAYRLTGRIDELLPAP